MFLILYPNFIAFFSIHLSIAYFPTPFPITLSNYNQASLNSNDIKHAYPIDIFPNFISLSQIIFYFQHMFSHLKFLIPLYPLTTYLHVHYFQLQNAFPILYVN